MKNPVELTQDTARTLVAHEFGLSGAELEAVDATEGVHIYQMLLGRFVVTVENDWHECDGLLRIRMTSGSGESMQMYYHPETFAEDCAAGDKYRAAVKQEHCEDCMLYQAANCDT